MAQAHPPPLDPLQPPCQVFLPGTKPPGLQFLRPGTWAACPRPPERAWGPRVPESVKWWRGCLLGGGACWQGTHAHLRMLWDREAWRRKPGRFSGLPSCHRPRGSWRLTLFRRVGFLGLCPPGSWRREGETGCDSTEPRAPPPAASALAPDVKTRTGQTLTPADPEPLSHSEGQMGPLLGCSGAQHSLPQLPIQSSVSRSWPWLNRRLARLCVFESALGRVGGTRRPPRGP